MSVLPSFKSVLSSLADADTPAVRLAEDSGVARSPPHRPWSPLHTSSSDRRALSTTTTPSTRPSIPPLPLDNLIGDAPAFGFARPEKYQPPRVEPLPLEVLGLAVDGLVYVRSESKRTTSPTVHAGAYKRPRRHSVSAGGSYVKVSSQPSSERLLTPHTPKHYDRSSPSDLRDPSTSNPRFNHAKPRDSTLPYMSPSVSSSAQLSTPSDTRPSGPNTAPSSAVPPFSSVPRVNTFKTSNSLSLAPPSYTRSAASKGHLLSFQSQIAAAAPIIEDSTCPVPVDVLSSPMQRSINSAATARTPQLRSATGNNLPLSRGPTASDLSHLLGHRRNFHDGDVVDGTDSLAKDAHRPVSQPPLLTTNQPMQQDDPFERERKVGEVDDSNAAKSEPQSIDQNPSQSTRRQQQPVPTLPPRSQPPKTTERHLAKPTGSHTVAGERAFPRNSPVLQESGKHDRIRYDSLTHQPTSVAPPSQAQDAREEEQRPEPWRQQPRPLPVNGVFHSQRTLNVSRDQAPEFIRQASSIPQEVALDSRERYDPPHEPSIGQTRCLKGTQRNEAPVQNGSVPFRGVPCEGNSQSVLQNEQLAQAAIPNHSSAPRTAAVTAHDGQLNDFSGNDIRDDSGSVQCPHCPRKLRNHVTLQNHIRVVHDHSGNFRCSQCGLTFMWRSTLGNHVRLVHEKQRPFACEQCAKAFRWKSHLREHFWVVHKGEKPFRCETCGKTFGRKNNMQKHMRKHTEGASG